MIAHKLTPFVLALGLASLSPSLPVAAAEARATAAVVQQIGAPDPAAQIEDSVRMFRRGDVRGLVKSLVPPSKWEEVQLTYELAQLQPIKDEDRAEFSEKLERITGPNAVDELMAQIEPELEKARPQLPGALLMGFGAMQMAVHSEDSDLSPDQRAALKAAIPAIQQWAHSTDFLSSQTLRDALTLLSDAIRSTGITDLDQFKNLPLDAALDRAAPILAAAKQAVLLYGIDLDAVADSLRVEVLDIEGEKARVRTTVTLFDAPLSAEHDLVLVDGRWFGKDAARHWHDDGVKIDVDVDVEVKDDDSQS